MSTALYSSGQVHQTPSSRWLWAAVGALGATTLALGVAVVQMRTAPVVTPVAAPMVQADPVKPASLSGGTGSGVEFIQPKVLQTPVKSARAATKKIASGTPASVVPATPAAPPVSLADHGALATPMPPPPPKAVCAHCGTVEAVTPVQRDGAGSGAGVVAGAVLGGVLGNQVGGGSGKTIATVLGAVGGGWAGNTVEKRMKKETVYLVDVRMDDGSSQRVEHRSPVSVGAHVSVNAGVLSQ